MAIQDILGFGNDVLVRCEENDKHTITKIVGGSFQGFAEDMMKTWPGLTTDQLASRLGQNIQIKETTDTGEPPKKGTPKRGMPERRSAASDAARRVLPGER